MNKTKIEYLDYTWNPIAMRCTPISTGCANCWHLAMATRLAGNKAFAPKIRAAYAGKEKPVLVQARLTDPLIHKKPAVIGVQFMGDLFHEDVPFGFIGEVFATIIAADWHTFQILTKRVKRMQEFMAWFWKRTSLSLRSFQHIWLGVTIEAPEYSYRADYLRQTPAAVRFLSMEPLLVSFADCPGVFDDMDWVVVGGESGLGARPMYPDWARGIRDQCQAADVPFFFKQWGRWKEIQFDKRGRGDVLVSPLRGIIDKLPDPFISDANRSEFKRVVAMSPVGKNAAGRLLDGKEHNEMPERRQQ